jgi:DNA-binding GntR family transcriptional regulator
MEPKTKAQKFRPVVHAVAAASTAPSGSFLRLPPFLVEHPNLEDKVYPYLKSLIAERRILPGEKFAIDDFAREMRVSRTPILNALRRLAQEGVVEFVPRRGVFVRRFTKRQMARLFEVREALECLAARRAATRIARAEVERLERLFLGFDGLPSPAQTRRYIERDRYFHKRLVEIADSPELARATDSVNLMFFAYQDGLVRPPSETIPEHRAILDALRKGDPEAGEAAMRTHIRRSVLRLEHEAATDALRDGQSVGPRGDGLRQVRR